MLSQHLIKRFYMTKSILGPKKLSEKFFAFFSKKYDYQKWTEVRLKWEFRPYCALLINCWCFNRSYCSDRNMKSMCLQNFEVWNTLRLTVWKMIILRYTRMCYSTFLAPYTNWRTTQTRSWSTRMCFHDSDISNDFYDQEHLGPKNSSEIFFDFFKKISFSTVSLSSFKIKFRPVCTLFMNSWCYHRFSWSDRRMQSMYLQNFAVWNTLRLTVWDMIILRYTTMFYRTLIVEQYKRVHGPYGCLSTQFLSQHQIKQFFMTKSITSAPSTPWDHLQNFFSHSCDSFGILSQG